MQADAGTRALPSRRQPPGPALELVRETTREAHRRLEARVDVLGSPWHPHVHRVWLTRTLGLLEPVEDAVGAWAAADDGFPSWPPRRRAAMVAADLRALGVSAEEVAAVPRCPAVAVPRSRAEALGTCYVLDGSTLGGALVRRAALAGGVAEQACTSFTGAPGAGGRWRQTVTALQRLDPADAQVAAGAALRAFRLHEDWLAPAVEAAR
ncbi:biliverdin-producing heme oxygenase [Kineococcus sp. NUM-3379]